MPLRESHVIGPPGTGKTTYTAKQIENACQKYDPETIIVMSFTKAAAVELGRRGLAIPRRNIATLHAFCHRILGSPAITEVSKLKEYNETRPPEHQLSAGKVDSDFDSAASADGAEGRTWADEMLQKSQLYRARMIDERVWDTETREWFEDWRRFKEETETVDYTDLLEVVRENFTAGDFETPPSIIFDDEAQDHSALELAVIRKLASDMDHLVVVGDPDQSIYDFKGADPEYMNGAEVYSRHVLDQSYRVPQAVHGLAVEWIKRDPAHRDWAYKPNDRVGKVRLSAATWRRPDSIVDEAGEIAASGRTVMILAACSYQLENVKYALRDRGLPFHNEYREKRGDWNPLGSSIRNTTAASRLVAVTKNDGSIWGPEADFWDWADIKRIFEHFSASVLHRGSKTKLLRWAKAKSENPDDPEVPDLTSTFLEEMFQDPEAYSRLVEGDLEWYYRALTPKEQRRYNYPLKIATTHGVKTLTEKPRITIGTIHSVKGGESDVVFIFPDISRSAHLGSIDSGLGQIIRTYYVGVTRAQSELVVCSSCEPYNVDALRHLAESYR